MTAQTLRGFLLTRNWRDTPRGVELEFWFASENGPLRVLVHGERSVFFVAARDRDEAEKKLPADATFRRVELRDFTLAPVVAVYFDSYRSARRCADLLREAGLEPLESDINPADRFLVERFIQGSAELLGELLQRDGFLEMINPRLRPCDYRPNLKVASIDIETAMDGLQLYSIGVHALAGQTPTRRVFMLGSGAGQDFVSSEQSQEKLLHSFLDWVADYDPDVLIGWNVINFDAWFLERLVQSFEGRLWLGRNRSAARWREFDQGERRTVQIPGRVILDGIELLRAAFYSFESFSLDNVARELLGDGKLLHGSDRADEISRLFREDKTRLAAYNLRDCELVSEIFEHTALLDFALARSAMTGLNIDRMGGSVASFDNLYLPRLHRCGFVAPNASREHIASPGGFVLDSLPGIYDHVLVLDFKSLYPSIIRTFCIDPLGLALGSSPELDEGETVPGFLGARFARQGHILPELIRQLWAQRDAAKAAQDGPLSQAIKIIMNSFYGVLGTTGCRFFDARLASSITRRGHEILRRTRDHIERAGHRVIYGDTDSVFVWIHEARSDAEAVDAGQRLEADLNCWWRQTIREEFDLESMLEVEFETHFRRFLMPTVRGSDKGSKKRYAGTVPDGDGERLVFKGLENVRTDWTRLAREFQEELYRRVFARETYEDYVRELAAQVLGGYRDADLVYRKRLRRKLDEYERNIPPHVQAARRYAERGLTPPPKGGWVEYVMTTAGAEPAAAPSAPLDYQHYVDRQLQPVADGILGFLDSSFSAVVGGQRDLF